LSFHDIDPEVKKLLMDQEDILLTAKQAKGVPGGSISTPNSIYVTNTRVIFKNPKLFGLKADIIDVNYRDISNVRLKRGMFSTEIYLNTRNRAEEISLPAVDKQIAQEVINLIQKGIQGELPNQSRTERKRPTPNSQNNVNSSKENEEEDLYTRLGKLADLKMKGALSEDEFRLLKSDILRKMSNSQLRPPADNYEKNLNENPVIEANSKVCSNPKCKSINPVTSLYCKFCGTKL
jgi:hypothetical protein